MPVRATKRGAERTRLERGDCDVLVCGASFAGLAVARELAGSGARVLVIDRYEIGERQTSACAMPTLWLQALDLMGSLRQSFDELTVHTPFRHRAAGRCRGRSRRSTTASCARCCGARPRAATWSSRPPPSPARDGSTVHTDRGELTRPADRGRARLAARAVQRGRHPAARRPPVARPRGPPGGTQRGDASCGSIPATSAPATPGAFPPHDELRVGAGSFWPTHHVKEPTVRLARELGLPAEGYQGNWIPHQLRAAVEDGVFFVGRLRRALPAADRRGHPHRPLLRPRLRARAARGARRPPLARRTRSRATAPSPTRHARKYRWLLGTQRVLGRDRRRAARSTAIVRAAWRAAASPTGSSSTTWRSRPPSFVGAGPLGSSSSARASRRMPSSIAGSARLA